MGEKRYSDEITFDKLGVMERIILEDAVDARGEMVGSYGSQQDKRDYETLADLGLFKRVLVKSGRHPEYGYLITQKGWEVWDAKTV